jgi:hypothetical protein
MPCVRVRVRVRKMLSSLWCSSREQGKSLSFPLAHSVSLSVFLHVSIVCGVWPHERMYTINKSPLHVSKICRRQHWRRTRKRGKCSRPVSLCHESLSMLHTNHDDERTTRRTTSKGNLEEENGRVTKRRRWMRHRLEMASSHDTAVVGEPSASNTSCLVVHRSIEQSATRDTRRVICAVLGRQRTFTSFRLVIADCR